MRGPSPEIDPFTRKHRVHLAFHLTTIRRQLSSVWLEMCALPITVQDKAIRYRRTIAEGDASGIRFLANADPEPGRDPLVEYRQAKANLEVLTELAPQIDSEVEKYVQTFIDELRDEEADLLFGTTPTRQHQYKAVMGLVLRPDRDKFLNIAEFLETPSPKEKPQWRDIALAYQDSVTPYTDAIEGTLARGFAHEL